MNARWFLWALAFAVLLIASAVYGQVVVSFDTPSFFRVVYFPLAGIAGMLFVLFSLAAKGSRTIVLLIWIPAIFLRVLLLPTAHSDDLNRYLWEGKLLAEGVSPYAQLADHPDLESYRDQYWQAMNHKDKPTAYPPLVLGLFAVFATISYTPLAFKLLFVAADLLTIGLLVGILKRRGLSPLFVGFYALNPVVLVSYAAEGHFDSLMIAPLIGGLWLWESKRYHAACAVATIGSGIKWMTLPLVPFLANRRIISCGLVAVACLGLPFVFYGGGAFQALTALFEFGGTRSFNGPLYDLLTIEIGLSRTIANACSACAFLLILLWRWFWRGRASFDSHCLWILGSLIVFSPTVHFWYIAWLLPFVALSPRIPWLVLSFSAGAYFFVWTNVEAGSYWRLTQSQRMIFWVPFLVSCLYELWSTRGQVLRLKRLRPPDPGRVAVIIPTLNAEENIDAALQSVARQTVRPDEIVLVDAGSVDATLERAAAMNLELSVIGSERGRGNQIAAGIEAAGSDWVLILHADAILDPHSVERLKRAYDSHPQMIAGALGQRFDGEHWQLSIIELLNELRAIFTRTAFGDQVQFLHRQTAIERELMPKQPLMEDVESSWRARTNGEFVYLGCSCLVSRRKWDHKDWFKRVIFVVRLLIRYRIARARGLKSAAEMSRQLYSEYYKSSS